MAQELLRKTIKAAATEETVALSLFVTRVRVYNRSQQAARVSFIAGEVATATAGAKRVTRQTPYDSGFLDSGQSTLYVSADIPGVVLEVYAEFYESRESGAFDQGFSPEFA